MKGKALEACQAYVEVNRLVKKLCFSQACVRHMDVPATASSAQRGEKAQDVLFHQPC
jgi:hypothetical protein